MKTIVLVLAFALLIPGMSWSSVLVSYDPPSQVKYAGNTFTVDIMAHIPSDEPVLSWGLDLSFDDTILALIGAPVIGPQWTAGPDPVVTGGMVDGLTGFAFPDPVTGDDILLATLSFKALAPGMSALMAGYDDPDFEGFWPEDGEPYLVQFVQGSSVTVMEAIPEPSSLLLMAAGLAGTWVFGRKRT
ncbi:hypothetical protein PLCT2_02055 [Planctomycetaceae bacterium]|nr:hypothetical protein PLCT2_02055 [Planctomycetaceae bacterium]